MVLSSIALALIALTAGMFLLAKAQKDGLNLLFKIVAYFVIIASLLLMACIGTRTMLHFYSGGQDINQYRMMQGYRFEKGGPNVGRFKSMHYRGNMMKDDDCTCPGGMDGKRMMHNGGAMMDGKPGMGPMGGMGGGMGGMMCDSAKTKK